MHSLLGIVLAAGITSTTTIQSDKELLKLLPEEHRIWLEEEVVYIISHTERSAFLRLQSENERQAFVDAFWRKRDENPATPENEYMIEHYERLAYANKFLGRNTFRQGWQTDMGRYFILLGPPRTKQNFEARDEIYPAELWFYNDGDLKRLNLPPFFFLLFFKRHATGEFELYNPITDGPQALLTRVNTVSSDFRTDIERAWMELRLVDPELAHASLSFRTDEGDIAQFQAPSFGTIALVDDIIISPFVGLDTSYAERLDFERGAVESDYMFTFVPSRGMMNILPGPANAAYLHWVIELDPQYVGFVQDQESGQFASQFIASMEVVPKDDPNTLVVEFRRESYIRLQPSDAALLHRPFAYSGMTPIVPGDYTVRIILRNRACPGRDERKCIRGYTLLDGDVRIPDWPEDRAVLGDLVLGYEQQTKSGEPTYRAFRFGNTEILPNPAGVYAIGDQVIAAIDPVNAEDGSQLRFQIVADELDGGETALDETVPITTSGHIIQELSLDGFRAARYELTAALLDPSGQEVDRKTVPLVLTPRTSVVRPAVRGSTPQLPAEQPGIVAMALGEQLLALGEDVRARAHFEAAVDANRNLGPARENLARFEMADGNTASVIQLLAPVYEKVRNRFEVIALLGHAYAVEEQYANAAELLERAITLRRPEVPTLNMLANAQYQIGNYDRAIELLNQSLSMDADQEGVQQLLERVEADKEATPNP